MFQVTRSSTREEGKWKTCLMFKGSHEKAGIEGGMEGKWVQIERTWGWGLSVLAVVPANKFYCTSQYWQRGGGLCPSVEKEEEQPDQGEKGNRWYKVRDGRRKIGNDTQSKGQRSFDVTLVWLQWESHLYCSGALCPDLKRADSDSSLEPSEAYFLIKECYLWETLTVGLS